KRLGSTINSLPLFSLCNLQPSPSRSRRTSTVGPKRRRSRRTFPEATDVHRGHAYHGRYTGDPAAAASRCHTTNEIADPAYPSVPNCTPSVTMGMEGAMICTSEQSKLHEIGSTCGCQ